MPNLTSIPVEILREIVDYFSPYFDLEEYYVESHCSRFVDPSPDELDGWKTLFALSKVSRIFRDISQPKLFQNIFIRTGMSLGALKDLSINEKLCSNIKSARFDLSLEGGSGNQAWYDMVTRALRMISMSVEVLVVKVPNIVNEIDSRHLAFMNTNFARLRALVIEDSGVRGVGTQDEPAKSLNCLKDFEHENSLAMEVAPNWQSTFRQFTDTAQNLQYLRISVDQSRGDNARIDTGLHALDLLGLYKMGHLQELFLYGLDMSKNEDEDEYLVRVLPPSIQTLGIGGKRIPTTRQFHRLLEAVRYNFGLKQLIIDDCDFDRFCGRDTLRKAGETAGVSLYHGFRSS